jgi:hypothetical protein
VLAAQDRAEQAPHPPATEARRHLFREP